MDAIIHSFVYSFRVQPGTYTVVNPLAGFHLVFNCNADIRGAFTIDFGGSTFIFTVCCPLPPLPPLLPPFIAMIHDTTHVSDTAVGCTIGSSLGACVTDAGCPPKASGTQV